MFIEGEGEFPLAPGMVVQVPQNALHAIRRVEEEFLMYNVFAPGRLTGRERSRKSHSPLGLAHNIMTREEDLNII